MPAWHFSVNRFWRRLLWLVLSAAALSPAGTEASPPNYALRTWQTEQGLPHNAVTAILQSRDGYLWLGSYAGLIRFDGVHFKLFETESNPGLKNNRISNLYEAPDGALWLSHETGELTRFFNGAFEPVSPPQVVRDDRPLWLNADARGDIWILNTEGMLARLKDGLVILPSEAARTRGGLQALTRDRDGNLWLDRWGELGLLNDGRFVRVEPDRPARNYFIQGMCASREGGIWVAYDQRLRRLQNGKWTSEIVLAPDILPDKVWLQELTGGRLAIGNWNRGVFLVNPDGSYKLFCRTNGLSENWIRAFCEDREGNLWLGDSANGGLTVLRSVSFEQLTPPEGWRGKRVMSLSAEPSGRLWVGTEGAGLYSLLAGQWSRYCYDDSVLPTGQTAKFVWSVKLDAQERLWIGTWGGGLFCRAGDHFENVPGFPSSLEISAIYQGHDGALWVGTKTGLIRLQAGRQTTFGAHEGLVLPDVRAITETPDGVLWFGMAGGGLGCLKHETLKQYRKADGLGSDFVLCLRAEADGALWFGTLGSGLNRFKAGHFRRISVPEGLFSNSIGDIQPDDLGYWWLSSQRGVLRVAKNELIRCAEGLTDHVFCVAYGVSDGLPSSECSSGFQPASCRMPDGRLFFPTHKGLVSLDPAHLITNGVLPPVVIEQLLVDGQRTGGNAPQPLDSKPLRIPPGHQRFEFHYTALSFSAPEEVRFKYRLEGWENDWIDTADRAAIYSYLPPGTYSFRVQACNNDGLWNKAGTQLNIVILPHFWQTWWFRAGAYLAGATLVALAAWLVARQRNRRKIERLERQQALERERMRIANDIHDDLGAGLTRIMMLSQPQNESGAETAAPANSHLDRIFNAASELTTTVDEIVWAVNPQHDTLDSLANYLANYAQEFLSATGLRCRLEMPLSLPRCVLSAEWRHNVFLAFKESLNNIVKHAAATQVTISLSIASNVFRLTVSDNGKGFAPQSSPVANSPTRGNGLVNLQRRMEHLGGRCELSGRPGTGTAVVLELPLPSSPERIEA